MSEGELDDDAIKQEISKLIVALPSGSVIGISDFTDLVELMTGNDMAFYIARGALKRMASDGGDYRSR